METIEIEVYSFDELDDRAKERARAWWRDGLDYPWWGDHNKAIKDFAGYFGITVKDWSIGGGSGRDYIRTDASNEHFRGKKLSEFVKGTGDWWLDCILWDSFYDEFKRTGDAKYAFEQALETAIVSINNDIDQQHSDESVDDCLIANEYKFLASGEFWE